MTAGNPDLPSQGTRRGQGPMLPDEEIALEERLDTVQAEKREALLDPGPSWHDWFFFSAAKWYVLVGFLIVDSWEAFYLFPGAHTPAYEVLPVMAATIYLEWLLYEFLWFSPSAGSRSTRSGTGGRKWIHPVAYGRWTEEAAAVRAGRPIELPSQGPSPNEFL